MLEAVTIGHTFGRGTPFRQQVLLDVSLSLKRGHTVLLTGPSGSGKTTLARIMAGLERPIQGHVRLKGENLYGRTRSGSFVSPLVMMASQYPERQFFADTVWDELSWGMKVGCGMSLREIADRLEKLAAELELPIAELAERSPRTLSSGQQRKVALASLLALEPEILLLDEPLVGLNAKERRLLAVALRRWRGRDRAMLVIAHELELFLGWVDSVAILQAGRLVFRGSVAELLENRNATIEAAISLPPLVQLSRTLTQLHMVDGPVSCDTVTVFQQFRKAMETPTGRRWAHVRRNSEVP